MSTDNVTPIPGEAEHNAPAAIPGFRIADTLGGADICLGRYLHEGRAADHRGAIEEAMRSLHAITDVLSALDDVDIETDPGSVGRLSMIARGLVERVDALRDNPPAEGGSDG